MGSVKYRYWAISIVIFLAVSFYLFHYFYQLERERKIEEIVGHQKIHAKQAARSFYELFNKWDGVLLYLSSDDDIIEMNPLAQKEMNQFLATFSDEISGVTRTDKTGKIIYTTPYVQNSIGTDISNQPHMKKILFDHKPVVSDLFNAVQGYNAIVMHYPVFKDTVFDGTIAFLLNFSQITQKILDEIKIGKTGYAWMLSGSGIELYCPVPGHVGKSINETASGFPALQKLAKEMLEGKEGVATYSYNRVGETTITTDKIVYFLPIKINNTFWSLAVTYSIDEVTASLSEFRNNLLFIVGFIFLGGIFFSYFVLKAWIIVRESKARMDVENKLKESEERYRLISTAASDYMFSTKLNDDGTLKHEWVAGAFEAITEYSFPEYLAMGGWRAALHPDDIETDDRDMEKLGNNQPVISELRTITKTGKINWVRVYGHPVWDEKNNKLIGVNGAVQDITERKTAEIELRENEEKFRIAFNNAPTGMSIIMADGQYVEVNPFLCKMFGYTKEELLSGTIYKITHPDDVELSARWIKKMIAGDNSEPECEKRYIHKDGHIVWGLVRAEWIKNEDGTPKLSIAHILDITERKKAEAELKKLYLATEQGPAAIVITDNDGIIEYVNTMFTQISGYASDEVKGKKLRILREKNESSQKIWKAIKRGIDWKGEYFNKRKDGSYYWESTLISPIKNTDGVITNFLAIQEDVSEKKETLGELILAKEKAEQANHVKNVFLANMSHELRTPLIGILGYSEMLTGELKGEEKEMASGISRSGNRLLKTLNLILDLTKVESEKFDLDLKSINLVEEIKLVYHTFRGAALEKKIDFILDIKEPELYAVADDRMFRIILENLINNAIKFTDEGSITISAGIERGDTIFISVIDTGIGIEKENFRIVFEEFRQVSEGINRDFQGTGLGLSITKKYVEILGGSITLDSVYGQGSTFTARFPLDENGVPGDFPLKN